MRPKIGSVYETPEFRPDIVVQLVGDHEIVGQIARVCHLNSDIFSSCDEMATLFVIGFPFSKAVKDGYLKYVGTCAVPDEVITGNFRSPNFKIGSHEIGSWVVLEGNKQIIVKSLSVQQCFYPFASAVNYKKLEELVDVGWNGKDPIR